MNVIRIEWAQSHAIRFVPPTPHPLPSPLLAFEHIQHTQRMLNAFAERFFVIIDLYYNME